MSSLQNWLTKHNATDNTIIKEVSKDFRTVYSSKQIEKNEIVLSIPVDCMITETYAKNMPFNKNIIASGIDNSHVILATALLYEKSLGNKSQFYEYIKYLPETFPTHPLFINDEDLELFKGSGFYHKLTEKKNNDLLKSYEMISKTFETCPFTFTEYVWARTIIITRVFQVTYQGVQQPALVPLADMLNHQKPEDVKTHWNFDEKTNTFNITAKRNLKKGEELFDTYGHKCNYRFVINYGFFLENNRDNEELLINFENNNYQLKFKSRPEKIKDNYETKYTLTEFYNNRNIYKTSIDLVSVTKNLSSTLKNILEKVKEKYTNYQNIYTLDWTVYNMIKTELTLCEDINYFAKTVISIIEAPNNSKKIKKKIKHYFADEILYFLKKHEL
jgi:hypothetical protein